MAVLGSKCAAEKSTERRFVFHGRLRLKNAPRKNAQHSVLFYASLRIKNARGREDTHTHTHTTKNGLRIKTGSEKISPQKRRAVEPRESEFKTPYQPPPKKYTC